MTIQDLSKGYLPILLVASLVIGGIIAGVEIGTVLEGFRQDHNALVSMQKEMGEIKRLLEARPVPCNPGGATIK
ncbi:MAG: hypothetical protein ACLPWS_08970 [Rhodomicrobium sp.]